MGLAPLLLQPTPLKPDDAVSIGANLIDQKVRQGDRLFVSARDFGGTAELAKFLRTASKDEIRNRLSAYGIKYVDLSPRPTKSQATQTADTTDDPPTRFTECEMFLPFYLYNAIYLKDGTQTLSVDNVGRPGWVQWVGAPSIPLVPSTRTSCQTTVGKWGVVGDDGGHLVPFQLGGVPWRVNLTPQNSTLNRGDWRNKIEDIPVVCRQYNKTVYQVTPQYPSDATVRPDYYFVYIEFEPMEGDGFWPYDENGHRLAPDRVPNRVLTDFEKGTVNQTHDIYTTVCKIKVN